jgi:hypothetical protein
MAKKPTNKMMLSPPRNNAPYKRTHQSVEEEEEDVISPELVNSRKSVMDEVKYSIHVLSIYHW